MKNLTTIKARYLRDDLTTRLGGLAANLARIKSFSNHPDHRDVVSDLLDESKHFIEWTAAEAEYETQVDLLKLQRLLVGWHRVWRDIWSDENNRADVALQAGDWSKRVLEMSGLLGN
ncbi:MAG: hypothetical protein JRJ87_26285 [Deltaproteobacteria bacterium]|nr:hypothetical protein [Deltaproteobacteria bacterium]